MNNQKDSSFSGQKEAKLRMVAERYVQWCWIRGGKGKERKQKQILAEDNEKNHFRSQKLLRTVIHQEKMGQGSS